MRVNNSNYRGQEEYGEQRFDPANNETQGDLSSGTWHTSLQAEMIHSHKGGRASGPGSVHFRAAAETGGRRTGLLLLGRSSWKEGD